MEIGPNNTAAHPPSYCPPTPECQIQRLARSICEPQGIYEPTVCEEGYYCPPGGKEKISCPSGSYCPRGSYAPIDCGAASICPAGSAKRVDMIGVAMVIVLDAILISATIGLAYWKRRREGRASSARSLGRNDKCKPNNNTTTISNLEELLEQPNDVPEWQVSQVEDPEEDVSGELQRLVASVKKSVAGDHVGLVVPGDGPAATGWPFGRFIGWRLLE